MANADKPAAPPPPETTATPPPAAAPAEHPARQPRTPERMAQDIRRLDRGLAVLLFPLAFLLASFAIHNSDFWMHLATGRDLVQGAYDVFAGNDPFSATTAGTHWINHAWLFDGAVYGLYLLAGGPGLVLVKGVLVVALAVVLFQMRRAGQSLWAPVVCVGLAVLALSPRLLFQPIALSLLFLGVTLALLLRAGDEARPSSRALWLLVPLFALWANLDNWFVLGLLTVALYLLGDVLSQFTIARQDRDGKRMKSLALVLVVSLAACLVNPNGLRVFALPPELAYFFVHNPDAPPAELTAAGTTLRALTRIEPTFYHAFSPLSKTYWSRPEVGLNVTGLTYFVLLGLGIVSFLLTGLARRGAAARLEPRLLTWLVFAALSLLMCRFIPFFAVVAGPLTALNLQDFARQRFGSQVRTHAPWGLWSLGGRLVTALGCLGLLFLAWPGWLHGRPDDPRVTHRVAWRLYEDPSLRQATERLRELQKTGKLASGFNCFPDVANYMAWFCPEAKSFFDTRLALAAGSVEDYARARQSLLQEAEYIIRAQADAQAQAPRGDWQQVFRSRGVNYLILSNTEGSLLYGVLVTKFRLDQLHWALLYADGRTTIFGWQPEQPHAFRGVALDLGRLAFGPVPEDRRAPPQAPPWPSEPRDFWQNYWAGVPERPLAASEGRFYLADYQLHMGPWLGLVTYSWRLDRWLTPAGTAAVIPGSVSLPAALAAYYKEPRQRFVRRGKDSRPYIVGADSGPPADPVLAVRSGRRAIAASPEDAFSYLLMADAYHSLWEDQEQRWVSHPVHEPQSFLDILRGNLLERPTLRQIQFATALSEFARLQAEQASITAADVHWQLAQIFLGLHYKDLGLEHLREAVAQLAAVQVPAAQKEQLDRRREVFERVLKNEEADVKRRQDYFKLQTAGAGITLFREFEIALLLPYQTTDENNKTTVDRRGLGLARQALEILRRANVEKLSNNEKRFCADLQLRLLLTMGQAREAGEGLSPALKPLLGPVYEQFEAVRSAAIGDYQRADQALAEFEKESAVVERMVLTRQAMLTLAYNPPLPSLPIVRASQFAVQQVMARNVMVGLVGQGGVELRMLRGLLALEQGDTRAAAVHLGEALRRARAGVFFPDAPIAERYLRLLHAP